MNEPLIAGVGEGGASRAERSEGEIDRESWFLVTSQEEGAKRKQVGDLREGIHTKVPMNGGMRGTESTIQSFPTVHLQNNVPCTVEWYVGIELPPDKIGNTTSEIIILKRKRVRKHAPTVGWQILSARFCGETKYVCMMWYGIVL